MTPERFLHLLSLVGPKVTKRNTRMREAISAHERLTLTLRIWQVVMTNRALASHTELAEQL